MSSLSVETASGRVSYAETGAGAPLVLLHSLLTDGAAFDRVLPGLPGRVLSMDLPGFGATEAARPEIDDFADRVAAFVSALGLDRPTLVGNGLGAFVALAAAIHHGAALGRLVLVGCGACFPEPARAAFTAMAGAVERNGMDAVIPVALRRIFTEDYIDAHPDMAEERAEVLRRTDPAAFITACRALAAMDYRERASTVANPTLIVVGEEDAATPPELAEELRRLIPDAGLVRLPGVAHAPQIQDPRGFLAAVEPFLEG